ncbi:biopolymer transporter ExbD [Sinimarinibacterium sp. NLF-5-8]|uniref:ExbD/TolR family protein n=1 Tax=Sinimarinibacterium sp. NLF-5-8 TaxID=2698684 RepID=UPI001EE4DD23|nr:biopolymer transporter ExbD [Sinimarinibacterium sp. NLF-5-8]
MSLERKIRRLQREERGAARALEINIVSLIDIFAILVLYLLVNALVVEVLPSPQALKLPESTVQEQPRQSVAIVVTRTDILVNNQRIMGLADAEKTEQRHLEVLKNELLRVPLLRNPAQPEIVTRGEINIMADRSVPYHLLKKVMATCTEARFAKISLAVLEKGSGGLQ